MIRYSHTSAGDCGRRGGLTAHWLTGNSEPPGSHGTDSACRAARETGKKIHILAKF